MCHRTVLLGIEIFLFLRAHAHPASYSQQRLLALRDAIRNWGSMLAITFWPPFRPNCHPRKKKTRKVNKHCSHFNSFSTASQALLRMNDRRMWAAGSRLPHWARMGAGTRQVQRLRPTYFLLNSMFWRRMQLTVHFRRGMLRKILDSWLL